MADTPKGNHAPATEPQRPSPRRFHVAAVAFALWLAFLLTLALIRH